jgi:hypothetical protein
MVHDGQDRLAHVALPGEGRADPVAQRARLRRPAADVVQRDRAQKRAVRTRISISGSAVPCASARCAQ